MKPHTKIYMNHFGYDINSWIPCEVPNCGKQCVDVHHVTPRSQGGKDTIENLMGLCRECHHEVHFGTKLKRAHLQEVHLDHIKMK